MVSKKSGVTRGKNVYIDFSESRIWAGGSPGYLGNEFHGSVGYQSELLSYYVSLPGDSLFCPSVYGFWIDCCYSRKTARVILAGSS